VLAAAVYGKCDVIVTENTKISHLSQLNLYKIRVLATDAFRAIYTTLIQLSLSRLFVTC